MRVRAVSGVPLTTLSIALSFVLFLVGCTQASAPTTTPLPSSGDTPGATPQASARTPVQGGTLTVGMPGEPTGTDPHIALTSLEQSILYPQIFDQLIWYDWEGEHQPRLLTSWQAISDTEWEFTLREGVEFHNGEPWNAEAFVWNWTRELDSGEPRHATLESLETNEVEIIDDYTVRVTTSRPYPTLLDDMALLFAVPPGYVSEVGDEAFAEAPVGTGPFVFVEWARGESIQLEANLDYWNGAPNLANVVLRPIPETSTRVGALQTGEVDMILAVPPDLAGALEAADDIVVHAAPINGAVYIEMFPESPKGTGDPLEDVRVRQALNYAVNVEEIIEFVLGGYAEPLATFINPLAFGHDPSLEPYPYDPARAEDLLAEAGYPDGVSIKFDLASLGLPNDVQVLEAVIADWARVGITAEVEQMDTSAIVPLKLSFEIAPLFYWSFRGFDADYIAWEQMHSGGAWFFYPGWTQEVDDMLEAQRATVDPDARREIWTELQQRIKDDAAYVPLYQPMALYGVSTRVDGFEPEPKDTVFLGTVSLSE